MNRKYSLKKNKEIESLIKGKQSVGNRFYAIYYQTSDEPTPKIAFSISKKFKTAVKRNYEKRVTKEIFRKHLKDLNYLKLLVIVKVTVAEISFLEKENQLRYLINKMLRSKYEKAK